MRNLVIICLIVSIVLLAGCTCPCLRCCCGGATGVPRFEHVAINVPDPVAMAEWWCEHMDMKIAREGPPPTNMRFISDAGGNMMLELYTNPPDAVPDYKSMDPLLLHIAFMVDDVNAARDRLIAAGGTAVDEVKTTPAGDVLAIVRDPWGVPIQLLTRAEPMLSAN